MRRTYEPAAFHSSSGLRQEVSARNIVRCDTHSHEISSGDSPVVLYTEDEHGTHGNFYPPAYRRILANPGWRARLEKAYTASAGLPHPRARARRELDTACSSDALLMTFFCAPGALRKRRLQLLLDISATSSLQFGYRTRIPLAGGYDDRTEADLAIICSSHSTLLIEAKLTETGFQSGRAALLARYPDFEQVFESSSLPRNGRGEFLGYQLLRNVLATDHHDARFALLVDARRLDLHEQAFRIFATVRSAALRSRLHLYTWQELAACASKPMRQYLSTKYGIFSNT